MTFEEMAKFIRDRSKDDADFVRAVNVYVEIRIKYVPNPGWTVKNAARAYQECTGDCSEKAVLKAAMLKSQGISCQVVHGLLGGVPHDTVQVCIGKYRKLVNPMEEDRFTIIGYGLDPQEVIV